MTVHGRAAGGLRQFRAELFGCFGKRRDVLSDLADALLTAGPAQSLAHLSLESVHRRGWGSAYDALDHGRVDAGALRALLAAHPSRGGAPVYAVDVTTWPRCDAECSPARGLYYHPSRHSAGQPIVAGWAYQLVAQLSLTRDSWTAPADARRLLPSENASAVAVEQVRSLLARLPTGDPAPVFVFDAGYDAVALALGLAGTGAAVLVRMRGDRCYYADVPAQRGKNGRPRKHGRKFACYDAATWWAPDAETTSVDMQYGTVQVRAWNHIHSKWTANPTRGTRASRPWVSGTLVLVEVQKLPRPTRAPRRLWLWWSGPAEPDLDLVWRLYVRRFDLEHTVRFLKQTLNWTLPRVRHPEQADRWTWLVLSAYTQLRLAREVVADHRLPWERPLAPARLTPARVRRGFSALLPMLGSPAGPPKPCGRSPGRPRGSGRGPAPRHPALKKAA
jgi:hypothetical protein